MRSIIWAVGLLLSAGSASADLSDSGNLTIGGQGVIVGTMTIQGNAFSVGGATFTVAGGSITLGGILNLSSSGIKWADGTTMSAPPSVVISSGLVPLRGTTWSTDSGSMVDVTNSTIQIGMTGGYLGVMYSCPWQTGSGGDGGHVGLKVNGSAVEAGSPVWSGMAASTSEKDLIAFNWVSTNTFSGSTSVSLTARRHLAVASITIGDIVSNNVTCKLIAIQYK